MNETHFERYARILVDHGAGLRPGQPLYIHAEAVHRDLARRVAEAGYAAGASVVSLWMTDPAFESLRVRSADLEWIEASHARERLWYEEILATRGALISLRGDEDPRLMPRLAEDVPERHAIFTRSANRKAKVFLHHGVNRSLNPWVVAAAATPAWAQMVFPELEPETALDRLWELIFRFTHADREDALERAAAKDRLLHERRRLLDELEIRELRVFGGGSDLRIGLSPRARWLGGSKETVDGQTFNANVPSEENFTTPDARLTDGVLRATMPFRTKNGLLVEGLEMHFRGGRLVDFSAEKGGDGFGRWIDTDAGARSLGEVALVGIDSPIAESGRFFEHTLLDENAWSHVALGQAYSTGLVDGDKLGAGALRDLGANTSAIHTDIMVGSREVSIHATCTSDGEVPLIENGEWAEAFRRP